MRRQKSLVGKKTVAKWLGFKSHLCYLLAGKPWACCIASLCHVFCWTKWSP